MIVNIRDIRKRIKQKICKHNYRYIAYNKHCRMYLWQCTKCKVYLVNHPGTGMNFTVSSIKKQEHNWFIVNSDIKLE